MLNLSFLPTCDRRTLSSLCAFKAPSQPWMMMIQSTGLKASTLASRWSPDWTCTRPCSGTAALRRAWCPTAPVTAPGSNTASSSITSCTRPMTAVACHHSITTGMSASTRKVQWEAVGSPATTTSASMNRRATLLAGFPPRWAGTASP